MRKIIIQLLLIIFTSISMVFSQENQQPFKWQIGEELTYKVSWGFIRLGTLKMSIVDMANIEGVKTYHTQLNIDSNPWLFIVSMHSQFDSYLMQDTYSRLFLCEETIDGDDFNSTYNFDYDNKILKIHYEDIENNNVERDTTIALTKKLQDGMSIIFYARANCNKSKQETLDVVFETKEGLLDINFTGKMDTIYASSIQKEVPALYLNGEAHFNAIAGFGGAYEGWFSTDEQHVPLAARMEVFVGSVYLELEEYKNWHPND